jgi:BirA family biotin operon repressor/biotin-[acetyl-CoA-carboxylase] ligase
VRLDSTGPEWVAEVRAAHVHGRFRQIDWVAETGSTNQDLVGRRGASTPEEVVLVADHQTAGRGRLDRQWVAPPGENLLVSVRVVPHCAVERWALTTGAMALAVTDVCRSFGVTVGIRWPNDVIVTAGAPGKVAGVLAELVVDVGVPVAVVVGVGINVGWPVDETARSSLAATSLAACVDPPPSRGAVLDALLDRFADMLALVEQDPAGLRERHVARSITVGRDVRIERADKTHVEGHALDVDEWGRIVVRVDGVDEPFSAGDVTHLR